MTFDTSLAKVIKPESKIEISKTPLAISYARVSSDGQMTAGSGISGQEQSCETWCKSNGDIKIIRKFSDEGVSWTVLDRKGLMDAIKFLENENKKYTKITHFCCTEISRIARPDEVLQWTALIARIESTWAKIVTTLEHRDTSSDEWKLMVDINFSFARYERKKTMKRAKNWMISLALHGKWPFGRVPVGYKKIGLWKKGTIEVDETKADIISRWLELFANNILITNSDLLNFFKTNVLTTAEKAFTWRLWMSFIEKDFCSS